MSVQGKVRADPAPGYGIHYPVRHGQVENWVGSPCSTSWYEKKLIEPGSYGTFLVEFYF